MYDVRYWLWLSLIFETGSPMSDSLLHAFNHNPRAIYEADKPALAPLCSNENILSRLLDKRLNRVYGILDYCQKENIGILTPDSRNFPSSLLKIQSQPLVLYYKGRLPDFSRSLGVAVVGTRSVTPYGSSAAYTISHDLASTGAVVVSGMALGADTAAHRGALDAGGHTVAFLGCGMDIIYPKDNKMLMQEIIASGTVMTEYAPGLPPEGRHFPVRNRLISGVSNAILVIEAAEKSGALITASHGLKQGKLIYAVPGKVGELSSTGTNLLIQNGAKMVTSAKDIISDFESLYEFRYSPVAQKTPKTNTFSGKSTDLNTESHAHGLSDAQGSSAVRRQEEIKTPNTEPAKAPITEIKATVVRPQHNEGISTPTQKHDERSAKHGVASVEGIPFAISERDRAALSELGFTDSSASQKQERLVAAQPRPTVLYNGMTEEEAAASYMSMETEIGKKPSTQLQNTERVYLTYPSTPMPKGGYTVTLSEEGLKSFENDVMSKFLSAFDEGGGVQITPYKMDSDPIKAAKEKKPEKKKRLSFKKVKNGEGSDESSVKKESLPVSKTEKAPEKPSVSFEGLSELETSVLKFILDRGPVSIDGMTPLNIPVSKLLATVTMLEIKKKISQKPGGYFDIK